MHAKRSARLRYIKPQDPVPTRIFFHQCRHLVTTSRHRHDSTKQSRETSVDMSMLLSALKPLPLVGEAHVHLNTLRSHMPFPLRQLALIIQFGIRDVARIPAAVFLVAEKGEPKALEVVARFGIDALHFPQEELLQYPLVHVLWMLIDGFASHCEDGAGLEPDGLRCALVTKVVEQVFEVLRRRFQGFFALEDTLWRRPLRPAWVFLPRDALPKVEQFHCAVRESGDPSWFGVEGDLLHLECGQIRMVIDTALDEQGDITEAIIVLDDVVKVGVTFTADVLEGLDVEAKLGCVLGAAFGVDLAMFHDRLKPRKVFTVVSDDHLKVWRVERRGRRGLRR